MNYLVKRLGVILFVLASPVFGFRCLAAGFPVSNSEIRKLVPELTNPRIMQLSDLNSQQRPAFTDYGFSFWLRGDFNMDQREDIVIAGHFDNIKNQDDQVFILVLSKFGNHWRRQYFLRPKAPVVSLS